MKALPFFTGLAFLVSVNLLFLTSLRAQAPPLGANGPNAQFTMDDGKVVSLRARGKNARRVLLRPGQTTTVILRYATNYSGVALNVSALDGGTVSFPNNSALVAPSGEVIIAFGGAQRPGLYRLLLNCGGTTSVLQFWVPGPSDPLPDASVLVPQPPA